MRKLTNNILSNDILNTLPINTYVSLGGEKEKIEKILNESYQYHPKCFSRTNKGDYSLLKEIVDNQIYNLKFIN